MNHYVYEVTNLINGKKYIGKRSCHCEIRKDMYMGSGFALKDAICKYGVENFKKDILMICGSEEEAYTWEDFYTLQVNAWGNRKYYNLQRGGKGGTSNISDETRLRMQKGNKLSWVGNEERRRKLSLCHKGEKSHMYGKPNYWGTHSEDIKKVIGEHSKKMWQDEEYRLKIIEGVSKKVILLNANQVFNSCKEASEYMNLKSATNITMCCRGYRKSAGKINGERAKWMYYDEYIKNNEHSI